MVAKKGDRNKLGHGNIWNKEVGNKANQPLITWKNAILQRDGFSCQHPNCKTPRRRINAVKIDSSEGYKLSNGITLCRSHNSGKHKFKELYFGIVRGAQPVMDTFDLKLRMMDND